MKKNSVLRSRWVGAVLAAFVCTYSVNAISQQVDECRIFLWDGTQDAIPPYSFVGGTFWTLPAGAGRTGASAEEACQRRGDAYIGIDPRPDFHSRKIFVTSEYVDNYGGNPIQKEIPICREQLFLKNADGTPWLHSNVGLVFFTCYALRKSPPPDVCTAASGANTTHPITPATGEKQLFETDWTDSASHGLSFSRVYRSQHSSTLPGLGGHWFYSAGASGAWLDISALGTNRLDLTLGSGNVRRFSRPSASSAWASDTVQTEQLSAITIASGPFAGQAGWRYVNGQDDSVLDFNAAGQLITQTQRNGWRTHYSYNAAGRLASITNHFGRSLRLAHNGAGQLIQIIAPDGQIIFYVYDGAARLSRVLYSDNASKTYLYENSTFPHLLTGVIDENNTRLSTYSYDAQGRAIETTKPSGADRFQVSYGPASAQNPTQVASATIIDPLGTARTYNYATSLSQLAVTGGSAPGGQGLRDAASRVQNTNGLLDSETDFLGITTAYQWDTARRLKTQETRAVGRPEQQSTSTTWHPRFRLPTQVVEQGKTTNYTYDSLGNLLTQTEIDTTGGPSNGQSRAWSYSYNAIGQLTTMTDPRGQIWSYGYDEQGNLREVADPLGQYFVSVRDQTGRVRSEGPPDGPVTAYQYDVRGRLTRITRGADLSDAQQQVSSYTYTPSGQIASASLPNGHVINYQYDAAQRLIGATDNRGNQIAYTLDAMGNRISETVRDATGQIAWSTQRVINSLNRLEAIRGASNPAQQTFSLQYDANGEPIRSTDPLGHATQTTLDALRRPVATTLPDNAQATSAYNALGQLTQAQDPKGVATQYSRNAWGEILSETSPDIGSIQYTRDAGGNVLTMTDAKGQLTSYQYDALGRVTQISFADGKSQSFFYNGNAAGQQTGFLREIQDASGSTLYERDPFGRITKKTQTVNDNPTSPSVLRTSYAYTAAGELAQIQYPSGLNVFYRRNASGQITSIDTQRPRSNILRAPAITPLVTDLQYTALGQPRSWSWNCITGNLYTPSIAAGCNTASRSFDADARMSANEFATLQYDAASRITGITQNLYASRTVTQSIGTETLVITELYPAPFTWSASYDARGRITSFNRAGSEQAYTYDANSNRLTSIAKKISDTDIDGLFEASDRAATTSQSLNIEATSNKLLGFNQSVLTQATNANGVRRTVSNVITAVNYQLDANGNLTSDGLRSFDYDANNRLSKAQILRDGEAASISFLHNSQGQRVFKSEPQTEQTLPDQSSLGTGFVDWLKKNFQWLWATAQQNASIGTSYSFADSPLPSWAILGEYDNGSASGSGRVEYIWLPQDDGNAIPVAMFRGSRYYQIHTDHLGTPRLIKDDSAKPVWQWAYSAFGDNKPTGILKATSNPNAALTNQPVLLQATGAMEFNLRFPGQYLDQETGQFYNYFRNYMPGQGRYTQSDPIGLSGGLNRFGYVDGNPINSFDPDGLNARQMIMFCAKDPKACANAANAAAGAGIAAATGAVSGAVDAVKELCSPDDPCEKIRREIDQWIVAMEKKYWEMQIDRNGLFEAPSTGTWEGHVSRYNGMKIRLRKLIDEAVSSGCAVPPKAYELLARPAPRGPAR